MASAGSTLPPLARSLSARLLVLTIFFVMLAEVFIFAPSVARFRLTWLQDRIASAHLATLALDAAPEGMVSPELERELLRHVGGYGVILQRPGSKALMLSSEMPPKIDATVDLAESTFFGLIADAFATLLRTENRVLRVMGPSSQADDVEVSVVLDEAPLRAAMYAYGNRILLLSVVISVFTAVLVYLSLHWLLVLPMRRITGSMVAFRDNPADPAAAIGESARRDEVGTAQRELAAMQAGLREALSQRAHLAALGEAVAKINHDLRNILATAQLVSERLAGSEDPEVKKATPTLVRALDRAAALCSDTLSYARPRGGLARSRFRLAEMLAELPAAVAPVADGGASVRIDVPGDTQVKADREQLFRAFVNLVKNAAEAGAATVTVVQVGRDPVGVEIRDDGAGIPERAREHLFKPFQGTARSDGTGLGLAIAREVAEAHGGGLDLVATGPTGTTFRLTLGGGRGQPEAAA